MDKIFSLKEACENKIAKVKFISNMPIGYLLLNFENNGVYKSSCHWIINDAYYLLNLDADTISPDLKCFTFAEGVESFGDYLLSEVRYMRDKTNHLK